MPKAVWAFQIGGYQVCEKWLKDRKGRKLSYDDVQHYQKVIAALSETKRLMAEIDALLLVRRGLELRGFIGSTAQHRDDEYQHTVH